MLFRVVVKEVREGIGGCRGGCEVEGSLAFGAGLVAASASSFSKTFTFRVSESTWKLSFLRSLSTLGVTDGEDAPKTRKHHHLHKIFVIGLFDFGAFISQILLHFIAFFL